jgi:peptide/nickel transport system permease protein
MLTYIIRRIAIGLLVILGATVVAFVLTNIAGDPAVLILPPAATAADVAALRERLGLNDPLVTRYLRFLGGALRGDFGTSLQHGESALPILVGRLPATLQLGFSAVILSVLISVPLGLLAALKRGTAIDVTCLSFAVIGQAMPNFWLAILLINLFSVQLGWLPTSGRGAGLASLVLPAVSIAMYLIATQIRLVRGTFLDVLNLDYMRTARAKGLRRLTVILKHGLRNALVPVVTIVGIQLGHVLGQAVVIETVFQWPGLGLFTIQAITNRDFPVIQASITLMAVFVVIINLIVDILYGFLDPTIREE